MGGENINTNICFRKQFVKDLIICKKIKQTNNNKTSDENIFQTNLKVWIGCENINTNMHFRKTFR
jgi:hypothetical protein